MTVSIDELAKQVQVLRDIEEIKRLKHAYFRCIDTLNIEELKRLTHPKVNTPITWAAATASSSRTRRSSSR